ncbi:MAG TPA: MIP/aquaporin family protein [Actinomycetales bacterium]|nr:MIP/aquaporin family protein [Actinomycetales bacterium]
MSLGTVFLSELAGTATLLLLGTGVVANVVLPRSLGSGGGWLLINFGWGLGVFAGVYVGYRSGAHLNPAVTLGILASGATTYSQGGVDVNATSTLVYILGEFAGAFLGAVLCWLTYKKQFDDRAEAPSLIFSTGPTIPSYAWNVVTEVIATFVLVFVILFFGKSQTPASLGPLAAALLVLGIGASLGGPTGYAINPARDLGPRIAHAVLPIPRKDPSNWGYSWVPVVGPVIGGVLAGLASQAF